MSNTREQLVEAYKAVIADISQDIGYGKETQEAVLGVLNGRVYELSEVWPFFEIVTHLEEDEI